MNDAWELLSCLLVIAFDDKRRSVEVMSRYIKEKNSIPQNIKETMKGLIDDFQKDMGEDNG